jgi:hypothetical protein
MVKKEKILEQIIIKDDKVSTYFILKDIDQTLQITDLLWIDCWESLYTKN